MSRRSPFEPEFHEEEADHPRMKMRNRGRYIILISAAVLIPLSVVMLIVTMVVWKFEPGIPSSIWVSAILHPFLSATLLLLAITVHRQGVYGTAICLALSPGVSFLYFIWLFLDWMRGF